MITRIKDILTFRRIGTTTRIAFAMAMWTMTVLLGLKLSGFLDDGHDQLLEQRAKLCESVAVSCSQLISKGGHEDIPLLLETLVNRNPELLSAGIRRRDGSLEFVAGQHDETWGQQHQESGFNRIVVPVISGDRVYANIEAAFESPVRNGLLGILSLPSVKVVLLATVLNLIGFSVWLRRCLRHLDPSKVVPNQVRSTLDTMADVIFVLDNRGRIMLTNCRLSDVLGGSPDNYQGKSIHKLPWGEGAEALQELVPGKEGQKIGLKVPGGESSQCQQRTYQLNYSAIINPDGEKRGTILSLTDITLIEEKSQELRDTLADLQKSKEEISEQNEQLQFLATRDPMTGCFNRRAFFETFASTWSGSSRYDHPLSCVMVDVDHFKSINDRFGHAKGDEVLKGVAAAVLETARDSDIVCRYGGEEFCVLLPHVDLEGATIAAERFRMAIKACDFDGLSVTASLGCSDRLQGAESAEAMLDQADQALYAAKRGGRNQVVAFDRIDQHKLSAQPVG